MQAGRELKHDAMMMAVAMVVDTFRTMSRHSFARSPVEQLIKCYSNYHFVVSCVVIFALSHE